MGFLLLAVRGRRFEPAAQQHRGGQDEFGKGDVFGPDGEEFGEAFCELIRKAVLVNAGSEVWFRTSEAGGEVEGFEGAGFGG